MEHVSEARQWNHLPDLVYLNIFPYLDRYSLNNLRKSFVYARDLIENVFGLDVTLQPKRGWLRNVHVPHYITREAEISHLTRQLEGKVIRTLRMFDLPTNFTAFPPTGFIQYPQRVRHVILQLIHITLLSQVLSQCSNLRTLEYTTSYHYGGLGDQVPTASVVATFNNFPESTYHLPFLKKLILTASGFSSISRSDWGNMAYLLVALPALLSLTTLKVLIDPDLRLSRRTHLLYLACIGDILMKTPSLQDLTISSMVKSCRNNDGEQKLFRIFQAVILKFGSVNLKQVVESSEQQIIFERRVERSFIEAAHNLTAINNLDLVFRNDIENSLLTPFLRHLPDQSKLSTCRIWDYTKITEHDTPETEMEKNKVYKLFTARDEENNIGQQQAAVQHPAYHQTLIDLQLDISFLSNTTLSLNKIMEQFPRLKFLSVTKNRSERTRAYVHFEENPVQSPYARLEQLTLKNLHVGNLRSPTPSITGLILECKGLQELYVYYRDKSNPWYDYVNTGIHVTDLFQILTGLPKLNKMLVDKVYFALSRVDFLSNTLDEEDQARKVALEGIGGILNKCPEDRRVVLVAGELRDVVDFDFKFECDDWEEESDGSEEESGGSEEESDGSEEESDGGEEESDGGEEESGHSEEEEDN